MAKTYNLTLEVSDNANSDDVAAAFERAGQLAAVELRSASMRVDDQVSLHTGIDRVKEASLFRSE